jgi:hypothetical protein
MANSTARNSGRQRSRRRPNQLQGTGLANCGRDLAFEQRTFRAVPKVPGTVETEKVKNPRAWTWGFFVELRGIEPLTSSMPCRISMFVDVRHRA